MKNKFALAIAIVLLWMMASLAAQLGNTDIGETTDNLEEWPHWFGLFVVGEGGDLDSVTIRVNKNATWDSAKMAVYQYSKGDGDPELTFLDSVPHFTSDGSGNEWLQKAVYIGASFSTNDTLCVAIKIEAQAEDCNLYYDAGDNDADSSFRKYYLDYEANWETPLTSGLTREYREYSGYIVYTVAGGATSQLHVKGTVEVKGTLEVGN